MAKTKFTRTNIHSNILHQILLRFDFTGSTGEKETEQFVTAIKNDWARYFRRYNKVTNKNFKIDISRTGQVTHEQQLQTIHRFSEFTSGTSEVIMDLSDDFVILTVNVKDGYMGSDDYLRCFSDLIHRILSHDVFIDMKRIGIRKFDYVFLPPNQTVDSILELPLWANYSDKGSCLRKEYKDYILIDGTSVNVCRVAEIVNTDEGQKLRLSFDADAYRESQQLLRADYNSVDNIYNLLQRQFNSHLFNIFVSTFTESFLDQFYDE